MNNYLDKYDIFKSYLVRTATFAGEEEFPVIKSCNMIPNRIVPFSEAMKKNWNDYNCWVCFYELDFLFIRIWNNPKSYLKKLKRFNGVISCDFSLYANMPLVMQKYHIYMGRAIANWLIENGINVIPNVRLGDERSYQFAFDGLNKNEVIAIGTIGTTKDKIERELIVSSIIKTIDVLEPTDIIIYGSLPKEINIYDYPKTNFHLYENYNYSMEKRQKNG